MVLDTKYKTIEKIGDVNREDRYQLITYIYTLGVKLGLLINSSKINSGITQGDILNKSNVENIKAGIYNFLIPQNVETMKDFINKINEEENKFIQFIIN